MSKADTDPPLVELTGEMNDYLPKGNAVTVTESGMPGRGGEAGVGDRMAVGWQEARRAGHTRRALPLSLHAENDSRVRWVLKLSPCGSQTRGVRADWVQEIRSRLERDLGDPLSRTQR